MSRRRDGERPTLREVAERAGVSRGLASLALRGVSGPSEKTREHVLAIAEQLGYRPNSAARALALERSHLIGVTYHLRRPFDSDLVEELYDAAGKAGYELLLSGITASRPLRRAVETLVDGRCAGLVLLGVDTEESWLGTTEAMLPTVVIGRSDGRTSADVVRTAGDAGVRLAVEHLIELGHRRIVHVDGGDSPSAVERRDAYNATMAENRRAARTIPGGAGESDGAAAAAQLLRRGSGKLPTAIVAYNDSCAIGLMEEFRRAGVTVPGQVSVVGYDNSLPAQLDHLSLTTVAQDTALLAELTVQRLVSRFEGDLAKPAESTLPPKLVVRATTGPPRAA
ncbi:LacI family DNA-binding transcriptional regulator [Amycolatopsis sp. La24]|uniref:LacI family DNA-binding transcriptional regulator n=1 Tax=Amycolatopsis sp. La24 TaxID=3028304 RepID=UPI0023AEC015|nr:LacI family DNA-binding transcriptional regulator [Amycolatopsis sp. La24]